MKTLFNRIRACATQGTNQNTMSNSNTQKNFDPKPVHADLQPMNGSGWQCESIVMSSESHMNHIRITYESHKNVSTLSAVCKSAWRYAAMLLAVLWISIANIWGETFTIDCTTTSSSTPFSVTESTTQYDYSSKWTSYNLIKMNTSATITITNKTGATITAITAAGVADNNSNKTVNFTISDGTTTAQTSSGSWNNRKSTSLTSKAFNATNVGKLKHGTNQTYTIQNMSSGSYNAGVRFIITYTPAVTNRTFNSGEIVYFKDNTLSNLSGSAWKNSSGNIYAYFFGDGTAWSTYGDLVEGSWNAANAIYKFTVPGSGKKFTTVVFTRGTAANFDSGLWNQTTDQTTDDQCNNLFTISNTKSGDKFTGSWSKWDGTLVVTRGGTEATAAAGIDCGASAGTLTCSATRGTIKTYQWKQTTSDKAHATNAVGTGTTTASFVPNTSTAGTYYYYCVCTDACGNTAETALSGAFKYNATAATYSVTHTLTNVTKTSGVTGAGAATNGVAYTAVFSANSGYTLPDAITVTIGGATQTAGTGYTWTKGTGTVTIPAAKVTGNIVITITGAVAASACSEPAKVTNEIARFFVPCGLSNSTGDGSAWTVTNQTSSTGDNTFTTSGFGGGSSNWYTNPTTEKIYGKLNGNSSYIQLKLKTGSFKAGDVVTAYFNRNSTTKTGLTLKTQGSTYAITPAATAANVETSGTYTLVAEAIETDGSIKLFRASSSTFVNFIVVTREPECTAPTGLTAGSVTTTGATFTVTDAANTNNYEFYYSTSSTAPTAGTSASTTSTSKTKAVTGLTAATTYYAWVRSVCSSTNKSAWVKLTGNSFTTLCTAPTSVSITGTYHYFPGETISLTAEPTGGAGAATYQWQKKNAANTDWVNISGATAATYTKASCDTTDASAYRCTVTCGTSCAKTSDEFEVKILQLYVYYNGTLDKKVAFTKGEGSVANAAPRLEGQRTYQFLIYDGCGHWYGNSGTMTSSNCTNWAMDKSNGTKCGITTNTKSADYAFTLDYSGMPTYKVSITYPGSNETAGKVIYWDNETVNWADVYYRIGRGDHTQATQMTLVPGTANLYTVTTAAYDNFEYWQICNNAGWTGSNPIDKTKTGDGYAITNSSEYYGSQVPLATSTYTPTDSHATGETDATNNCQFYVCNYASGMKTWKLTVSNPGTNGTLDVNYVDVTGAGQVIHGPGNQTLAHTCICIPTAVAYTGYEVASLTVNGVAQTNREPFHLTEASTVAVTFAAKTYTVTLNNQSATTAGTASVTTTYNASTNLTSSITCPTKTNYVFGGYFTETNGGGVQLIDATGAWKANVTGYTNGSKVWQHDGNVTLYAKWDANSCITITNFETTQHSKSDNKPDSRSKYIYGYKGSMTDANAVTMTITETNSKGEGGGDYFKLHYGKDVYIYSNNTTTGGTPTTFEDVTSVTLKVKLYSTAPTMTIKVGSTTIANTESLGSANTSGFTTFGPYAADNLDGVISIKNNGSGSTNYDIYIDDIEICTSTTGYVLSYNANGGTGTMATQSGTTLTVANSTFTRDGYAFNGWNTKANGTGTAFAAGSSITLTKDSTLYAQWIEEMESECSWAYYFVKAADATSNGKTNNTSVFTAVLGGSPGSGGSSGNATVDGTKYTFTGGSGSVKTNTTMVIPSGKKATLYIVTKKNGTNTITVKKGSTTIGTHTPTTDFDVAEFDNLSSGTYTINSTGNLNWYLFAANICADCADSKPVISYASLTGCPTVTLTATDYTDGALLQWYKKSGDEYVAIDAATNETYTVTETGMYKLAAQKTCRLETEPVSITIGEAVNTVSITSATTTYEQNAAATAISSSVVDAESNVTVASEYNWQRQVYTDGAWSAWTDIAGATSASYTPPTTTIGQYKYRLQARNNCNEGTWKTSAAVTINVIASSTVTASWKVDGTNVAATNIHSVKAGGWYDVKATFTTTTATPTISMVTTGIKLDNIVVDGLTVTGRVYIPASGIDTVKVKAAVAATTSGTIYSACETILKLKVTLCEAETKLPVTNSPTNAGNGYTGWRYYWETNNVGKITAKTGVATIGQESASFSGFSYYNNSNVNTFRIQTYIDGVSKIRIYAYNTNSKAITVSAVYYNNSLFTDTPEGYKITPTIVYQNPDDGGMTKSTSSYFDIVLSSPMAANSCLAFVMSGNMRIYGAGLFGAGASGTTPAIAWNQDGLATTGETVTIGTTATQTASVTTANFKSIATVQYSTSDASIATVNSTTGEVTGVAEGEATITAKLPASGCYKGSGAITYKVTVVACPDKKGTVTATRTDYCVGKVPVLTLTDYAGDILGWYKNGALIAETEGLTSYTVDGPGSYYAKTKQTCESGVNSNTIVIVAASAPVVNVLHSGWHVRRGREIGVPLQLFSVEGENLTTTITWSLDGTPNYKLNGVTCSLVDGIYQMTGTPAKTSATQPATLTGTITVTNDCGGTTTKTTTIIVDPFKEAKQIAYVVTGTKNGDWTAVTDGATSKALYTYLAAQTEFDVTACNGYKTTVLEDLLAYYSQYDVIVLTDYLNSGEKPDKGQAGYSTTNNISYSDAFGVLVDIKPMLTTEAYVSGKSQWAKVGLTSNPSDATNTDNKSLRMTLLCPAANIFDGIKIHDDIEGIDYIQVADALPGGDKENKMLQGFSPTAARDFVYMATVEDKNGKELICLCERQTELRARLMVFGLNWHGSEVMNSSGNTAVKQIIQYLLKWDASQIIDCAIYFDNKTNDGKWSTKGNWGPAHNHVPRYYENVRIEQPVTVDVANAVAANMRIAITSEGSIKGSDGSKVLNGHVNIAPTGALTVNGGVYMVDSKGSRDFVTKQQVPYNLLYIGSSASGQGALAFWETDKAMVPKAQVALYSIGIGGEGSAANSTWQYVGIPYEEATALYHFYGAWLCDWNQTDGSWSYVGHSDKIKAFKGYALTQTGNAVYDNDGQLLLPANKTLTLQYAGGTWGAFNLLANSFTAPIDLAAIQASDFDNAINTIYIYNTGKYSQWQGAGDATSGAETTTAGQYLVLPVNAAAYTSTIKAIPPLQAFYVKAKSGGGSFTIDYDRTILQIDSVMAGASKRTTPLRAPRRNAPVDDGEETGEIAVTKFAVDGETGGDIVHVLTGNEEFTYGFDNGWDGEKWEGDADKPLLAVHTDSMAYAVSSQPQLEGTVLDFHAGTDDAYALTITTPVRGLVLKDLVNNAEISLLDTTVYAFNSTNRTTHPRFVISRKHNIVTYTEQNQSGWFNAYTQGNRITIENKSDRQTSAYVYDTAGKLIYAAQIDSNSSVQVEPAAAQGVYLVRLTNADATNTIKVTF